MKRKILILTAALLMLMLSSVGVLASASAESYIAYITNTGSNSVSLIDTATNSVITTITKIEKPIYIALTPDNRYFYAVKTGSPGKVSVVNTNTNEVETTIPLPIGFPFQLAITPDGSRGYVAISKASGTTITTGQNRVEEIDLFTNQIVGSIPLGGNPYGPIELAITPDGNRMYVTHRGDGRVIVIDINPSSPTYNQIIANIYGLGTVTGIDITPDGGRAYASSRYSGYIYVIDTNVNAVISVISTGITSISILSVCVAPNGKLAFVTSDYSNKIGVIGTDPLLGTYNQLINTITVSPADSKLGPTAFTPDSSLAYIANRNYNRVEIIDVSTASILGNVGVGSSPFGIAIGKPFIEATVDIDPDTLNLKSKGKFITCYIELPEGYYVEDIDIDSVALTKVNDDLLDPPLYIVGPSEIGDYDDDGILDLMVKFDRQELIPLLEVGDAELAVSGELIDGPMFEGADTIRVIDKGKK